MVDKLKAQGGSTFFAEHSLHCLTNFVVLFTVSSSTCDNSFKKKDYIYIINVYYIIYIHTYIIHTSCACTYVKNYCLSSGVIDNM